MPTAGVDRTECRTSPTTSPGTSSPGDVGSFPHRNAAGADLVAATRSLHLPHYVQIGVTKMKNSLTKPGRGWSRAAAILLGMGVVTPAFGATVRLPFDMVFSQTEYILLGLLLALIVALVVSITMHHAKEERAEPSTSEPHPEGPDLRWWKGHPQT